MSSPKNAFSNQLLSAAAALSGAAEAADLLRYLGYDQANPAEAAVKARLLRAAATFRRLFRLPMPDAPGLVFFGAEADPAILGPHNSGLSVSGFAGSGLEPQRAFESCVGEGIEYLSQFAQPDDPMESGTIERFGISLDPVTYGFVQAVASACGLAADCALDWVPVRRLTDGVACWYPADLCLRRTNPNFIPPLKLSTGCAAGVTPAAAALHGAMELIERDAAALWWRGGRRGRLIAPNCDAARSAAALLTPLRQSQSSRQTSLLDITTDLGVPAVAAFSTRNDGSGFALGLAARATQAEAARSAILEMCQSELSLHVIAAKQRQSGPEALNESDLRQLDRATRLNPATCRLLQSINDAGYAPAPPEGDPEKPIAGVLADHGIIAYSLDLTRAAFAVPVVRVIAPGLQYDPCEITTARLAEAILETGGGAAHSGGVALL